MSTAATTSATSADDFDEEDAPPPPTILDAADASLAGLRAIEEEERRARRASDPREPPPARDWARLHELRERFLVLADAECPPRHTPEQCETWRNRVLRVRTNDHRLALDVDPPSRFLNGSTYHEGPFTLAEARGVFLLAAVARLEAIRQAAWYATWLGGVDWSELDRGIDWPEDAYDFDGDPRPVEGWPEPLPEKVILRFARRIRPSTNGMVRRLPSSEEQIARSYRHRATFGRTRDVGWAGHRRPGPKAKAAKAKPVKPSADAKDAARLQRDVGRVLQVLARCRRPEGLPGVEVQRRAKMKRAAVFAVLAHLQSAGRVEADGATKKKRFRLVAATSGSVPGSA